MCLNMKKKCSNNYSTMESLIALEINHYIKLILDMYSLLNFTVITYELYLLLSLIVGVQQQIFHA